MENSKLVAVWADENETIDAALKPLDRVAAKMERKWGVGRLVYLVTPDLAQKFTRTKIKLDNAIDGNDRATVAHAADQMIKAWRALDAAAIEAGTDPRPDTVWELRRAGKPVTVVFHREDIGAYPEALTIAELLEAYYIVRGYPVVKATVLAFPGTQVAQASAARAGTWEEGLDDEIPF
tara:strand:- start:2888 stop:3424 length:537 start_codon:yes stop_codon:yes gene_type:complete